MSLESKVNTLWAEANSYASFRAFTRVLRVAAAVGISKFLETLIPGLQAEPDFVGVPGVALVLLFLDKYLRDRKVY